MDRVEPVIYRLQPRKLHIKNIFLSRIVTYEITYK